MTDNDQQEARRLPAGHRPRRAPTGPQLDPADRPDPEQLQRERELAAGGRRKGGYSW